jgi:hypothetical protein
MVKLLQGSPVLSGESVRLIVRSYFVSSGFTSELVLGMPRADSVPTSKPGRTQDAYFSAEQTSLRITPIPTNGSQRRDRHDEVRYSTTWPSALARRRGAAFFIAT